MKITSKTAVLLDFILTDEKGEVLDSSEQGGPLAYIHGLGLMLPGLEKLLEGKEVGDRFKATLTPDEAYGERNENLVESFPIEDFEEIPDIAVGMELEEETDEGIRLYIVKDINDDSVTLDCNHPLAGMNVNFEVTVLKVRKATEEEIENELVIVD